MTAALEIIAREAMAFLQAGTTMTIVGLVFLDLLTGVIAAIRVRRFDLQRIGDFYLSNVIPYVIGYGGLYIFTGIGLAAYAPDGVIDVVQPLTSAPAIAALIGSLIDNVNRGRHTPAPPHEADASAEPPSDPATGLRMPPLGALVAGVSAGVLAYALGFALVAPASAAFSHLDARARSVPPEQEIGFNVERVDAAGYAAIEHTGTTGTLRGPICTSSQPTIAVISFCGYDKNGYPSVSWYITQTGTTPRVGLRWYIDDGCVSGPIARAYSGASAASHSYGTQCDTTTP